MDVKRSGEQEGMSVMDTIFDVVDRVCMRRAPITGRRSLGEVERAERGAERVQRLFNRPLYAPSTPEIAKRRGGLRETGVAIEQSDDIRAMLAAMAARAPGVATRRPSENVMLLRADCADGPSGSQDHDGSPPGSPPA